MWRKKGHKAAQCGKPKSKGTTGKTGVYGVQEGDDDGNQDKAPELGDFELCSLEEDTRMLSIGSTDTPAPE